MRIDYNKRLVFLENAKVASTSAETIFSALGVEPYFVPSFKRTKHIPFSHYKRAEVSLQTQSFRTISVVRHPIGKLISWYKYRSRPSLAGQKRYTGDMSFSEFIEIAPEREIDDRFFVVDEKTGETVDLLFKYENINQFFDYIRLTYQTNFTVPVSNKSPEQSEEFDYQIAEERFADAIRWYNSLTVGR